MIEQTIGTVQKYNKVVRMWEVMGFCLPVVSVIGACFIWLITETAVPVEQTWVLILACLFVLVPLKSETAVTIQKVVTFYLVCVVVNEISSQYFRLFFLPSNLRLSWSIVVVVPCAIGYFLGRAKQKKRVKGINALSLRPGWTLGLAIIVIHMLVLIPILVKFYGYGYERNLSTLGQLGLYLLLFLCLWEKLDGLRFRQIVGLALGLSLLAVSLLGRPN